MDVALAPMISARQPGVGPRDQFTAEFLLSYHD